MILPAIDIIDGACVRLSQGDFERKTTYTEKPQNVAAEYMANGARYIHIVDLDAARGGKPQTEIIRAIADNIDVPIQVGGGVRTTQDVGCLIDIGASRILIGSIAVKKPETVIGWAEQYGAESIGLALDVRYREKTPYPAIHGWQEDTQTSLWELLGKYDGTVRYLLVTDISRDGVMTGPNVQLYREITERFPTFELIGSGGVGTLPHVASTRSAGCSGLVVGKALFEGKFSLQEAIKCWQNASSPALT